MAAAIHFKFASFKEKQTIAFDGFNMSVKDVKQEIMERLKLKSSHDNLILTNSQTAKAYTDDSSLIQKNTTLLVRRVPKNSSVKKEKIYVVYKAESNKATVPRTYKAIKGSTLKPGNLDSGKTVSTLKDESRKVKTSSEDISQAVKTITHGETENDKIKKAIEQSTMDYDIAKMTASSIRAHKIQAKVKCFNCFKTGHSTQQCQMQKSDGPIVKPSTGIPSTMMVEASKDDRGAMLNPDGKYVVSLVDKKGYEEGKKERPPFIHHESESESEEEEPIPDEYVCGICNKLIDDAMLTSCCGYSFCDFCIRSVLIDEGICPLCKNKCSPDKLLPNISIRLAIRKFRKNNKSHRPMWPKAAPPTKNVNKTVALGQSLKPAVKTGTSKDTSKGVPYKVVSTTNQVKKKPSAPIGPICIQIPVPKMDPAQLKAKTDAILKDTAEAEAAEKAAAAAEKSAAMEVVKQEKSVNASEEENLAVEKETENAKNEDLNTPPKSFDKEENVFTEQTIEDKDRMMSSVEIKSIEPLSNLPNKILLAHGNVDQPISHVLPIQSTVAETLKTEEIPKSSPVTQSNDEVKTRKSSEKQSKEGNNSKSNKDKKRSRSSDKDRKRSKSGDRRRRRSTSRNKRDDRYESRSYRYNDSERDRRRRYSPQKYRELNPMLTTNTGNIASTQAINSTRSILGEVPSKAINLLPQIPPITTPFSVPPPTLNPFINPLLHSNFLGLPPTLDTSVPPPNMIPPPGFVFPPSINPALNQLLPPANNDVTNLFKGHVKKFGMRSVSPLNDRHRRREYSPMSSYRRDHFKKRDHRHQTSRHSKRDRRRSRSFSPYYSSRERSYGTLTGSSSHSSRSRTRSPLERKIRYHKSSSRRERSPARHHGDKYKSSKRRYNSREKHTSHHRSRTPQKRLRKRRDSRSLSRGRQQRRIRSKERRRKEQELLLASEAKLYQHHSERQNNNNRNFQPRPVMGHAGEPSPPGESLDVYDPSQVSDVLQRESFYEKMHQNLLKTSSENYRENPQGLWHDSQDFEKGNSADDATPVRDELSPSDNYHGNNDSRRLVVSNEQRNKRSPIKNIKYDDRKNHRSTESNRRIYRSNTPSDAYDKKELKKSSRRVVEEKKNLRNQSKSKKSRKSNEKELKQVGKSNIENLSVKVKKAKDETSLNEPKDINKDKNKQLKVLDNKLSKSQNIQKVSSNEQNKSLNTENLKSEKNLSPLCKSSKTENISPPGEDTLPKDEVVKTSKVSEKNSLKQSMKNSTHSENNEGIKNVSKTKVKPQNESVSNKEKVEEKQKVEEKRKVPKKSNKKQIVPVQFPQAPKSKWDTDNEDEKPPVVKRKKVIALKSSDSKKKVKKTELAVSAPLKPRKIKIKAIKNQYGNTNVESDLAKSNSATRKVMPKVEISLKRKSTDQSTQQNDARSIIEKNIAKRRKVSVESAVVSAPNQPVTNKSNKNKFISELSTKDDELTNTTEASLENGDSNSSSTENESKKTKAERKAEKAAKKLKKKKKKAKKAKKNKKEKRQEESQEDDQISLDYDDSDFEKETMEYEKRSKKKVQKSSRQYRRSESYEEEEKMRYKEDRMPRRHHDSNHKSSNDYYESSYDSRSSNRRHHRDEHTRSRRVVRDKARHRYRSRS